MLDMLANYHPSDRGRELGGTAVEKLDSFLNGGFRFGHGSDVQSCLHSTCKQVGVQGAQNYLHMKTTLGQQVQDFRKARGWKAADLAREVGTSRQNIESLEGAGNRIPKYLGKLAQVMGTTVDAMLAQAGLHESTAAPAPQLSAEIADLAAALDALPKEKKDRALFLCWQFVELAQEPDTPPFQVSDTAPAAVTSRRAA